MAKGSGIDLDEGIALTSPEEFNRFFVDTGTDAGSKLLDWIQNKDRSALFGGQIGSGKTTLIQYIFHEAGVRPDIEFRFDRATLNLSPLDSWSIVFTEVFRIVADNNLTGISEIPSEYKALLGQSRDDWHQSLSQIQLSSFSDVAIKKNKALIRLLSSNELHLPAFFHALMEKLAAMQNAPLILFASGLDKFEPTSVGYFSLTDILHALSVHKTLFEVNAVHLFAQAPWMRALEKILIPTSPAPQIQKMLEKRLGRYAGTYAKEIPMIAEYSGGIPRQALRLLDSFLAAQKQMPNKGEAFLKAVENVNRDFFAYARRPENALMANVHKNKFLETGLIAIPGDQDTARRSVFGNWILLEEPLHESRWKAVINPIIKFSFVAPQPQEPELALLKDYALQTGISDIGLDIHLVEHPGLKAGLLDQLETPIELNVTQILDAISNALLSPQRADRIIVAFKDNAVANAARAYFEAKSNTYEYQTWHHCPVQEDGKTTPLVQIIQSFETQAADIYSHEFIGEFSKTALEEMNIRRDSFIDRQLIWWIPLDNLKSYLEQWTQLRQLFQIYVLEEDLSKNLSIEDIQSDIDFMAALEEPEGTAAFSYVENLKTVLDFLKEDTHG